MLSSQDLMGTQSSYIGPPRTAGNLFILFILLFKFTGKWFSEASKKYMLVYECSTVKVFFSPRVHGNNSCNLSVEICTDDL